MRADNSLPNINLYPTKIGQQDSPPPPDPYIIRGELSPTFCKQALTSVSWYLKYAYPLDELSPITCTGQDTWGRYEDLSLSAPLQ